MEPSGRIQVDSVDETDLHIPSSLGDEIGVSERADSPFIAVSRLLWAERRRLKKPTLIGLVATFVITLLISNRYEATVQLMPPDNSSMSSMSALGAILGGGSLGMGSGVGGNLAGGLGELLGGQRPGALFVGILSCRTVADRIIDRFDLRK